MDDIDHTSPCAGPAHRQLLPVWAPLVTRGEAAMPTNERLTLRLFVSLLTLGGVVFAAGCTRHHYREAADLETAELISQRTCPEWMLPDRLVEADPRSRMADFSDPDRGPLPPDDPHAASFMRRPYRFRGSRVWQRRGELEDVEFSHWESLLPRGESGAVELRKETAIQLALLNSREYQFAVEQVYLRSLDLSLERFQFDTQWAAGTGIEFEEFGGGDPPGGFRLLRNNNDIGFSRRFAWGGQFLADFSNLVVYEFSGGVSRVSSALSLQFLQPLLRRAFREIQLEPLTQSERNLLYELRDYARFRREFYVNIVGSNGYLGLLGVAQAIRNQEENVESLNRNLEEHIALAAAGLVAPIQVDQVFQQYDQGRLDLLAARQALATALDTFKINLGLPPTLAMELDDSVLAPFEFDDPRLREVTDRNEELRLQLLQNDEDNPPTTDQLRGIARGLSEVLDAVSPLSDRLRDELASWQAQLTQGEAALREHEKDEYGRRLKLADRLAEALSEIIKTMDEDRRILGRAVARIDEGRLDEAWDDLGLLSGEKLREFLADLFVIQTQVRVYLVRIERFDMSGPMAISLAEINRLDLMNAKAQVVDAYRRVEVAADLLESDLDLNLQADLRTDPQFDNPFRFDASQSTLRAGLRFDGPLNRRAERNAYRAAQIDYQRERRDYMQFKDAIEQQIRNDLRALEFRRFQFDISRQQLITATRQVEEAQFNVRKSKEPNSSLTRDLLQALQTLLERKNSLIGSYVQYETARMNLFRDLGLLQVDGFGNWINDNESSDTAEGITLPDGALPNGGGDLAREEAGPETAASP